MDANVGRAVGMHKPIYRFLMNRKWREYRRPVLMQRLTQMHVMPDILPSIDPVVDVQVRFAGRDVAPGKIVESVNSERAPTSKRPSPVCLVGWAQPSGSSPMHSDLV